jgi:uncharacterized protein YndB with AHSA1/START domain
MTLATMAGDALVQEITIIAPAERVFAALTRPEELLQWWTVEGKVRTLAAECDVRPGGAWWMVVEGPCGAGDGPHKVYGVYRRVERPRLLELTWNWESEAHPESVVQWDLEERDGITRARVTHSGLLNDEMRERNNGWSMIVRLLEAWVEGSPQ